MSVRGSEVCGCGHTYSGHTLYAGVCMSCGCDQFEEEK